MYLMYEFRTTEMAKVGQMANGIVKLLDLEWKFARKWLVEVEG